MHKKESNHNVHPFMFRFCSPLPFMSPTRDLSPRACKKGRRGHNRYLRWKSLPRCCQKSRKREPNNSTIANIFPTRPQVSLQRRYISLFGFFHCDRDKIGNFNARHESFVQFYGHLPRYVTFLDRDIISYLLFKLFEICYIAKRFIFLTRKANNFEWTILRSRGH